LSSICLRVFGPLTSKQIDDKLDDHFAETG